MKTVHYTDREAEIVANGLPGVKEILMGEDSEAKERLLLCLDYYMDPYYGRRPDYERELAGLLQTVIISQNPLSVKEDALRLLTDYGYPPFSILEQGLEKVEPELRGDVTYTLNMAKTDAALTALLNQCASILDSIREAFRQIGQERCGAVPSSAIVKYDEHGDTDPASHFKSGTLHTWKLEQGGCTVTGNDVRHRQEPLSGMFFSQAAFWISFDLEKRTASLIYQAGPRFGRGLAYDLVFSGTGDAVLEHEQVIWVS